MKDNVEIFVGRNSFFKMGDMTGFYACVSRRKLVIFTGIIGVMILYFAVREKYIYRSDILVSIPMRHNVHRFNVKHQTVGNNSRLNSSAAGNVGDMTEIAEMYRVSIWDTWVESNPRMTSIGDIYDKCDNETRVKIGKVVLEKGGDNAVHITSYMNVTFNYTITTSTAHLNVYYRNFKFYDRDYDMCESSLKLDTPYSCPINKGKELVVRDVATLPWYIPGGTYKIEANVKDQYNNEVGCTFAEFKTGAVS